MSTLTATLCWCGQDLPHGLTATMLYHAGRGERVVVPSFLLRDAVAVIEDHHSARAALAAAVVALADDCICLIGDGLHMIDCAVSRADVADAIASARLIAGEGT